MDAGQTATANLGPSQNTYDDPATTTNEADQAVKVDLPDKTPSTTYITPAGGHAWWSGRGDDLDNTTDPQRRPAAASR